jgi:hypothetical protein
LIILKRRLINGRFTIKLYCHIIKNVCVIEIGLESLALLADQTLVAIQQIKILEKETHLFRKANPH